MANYTLTESQVLSLVERAVEYGVAQFGGQRTALAIQFGSIWLEGYIAAKESLTEDDIQSIRATIKNYYFI